MGGKPTWWMITQVQAEGSMLCINMVDLTTDMSYDAATSLLDRALDKGHASDGNLKMNADLAGGNGFECTINLIPKGVNGE